MRNDIYLDGLRRERERTTDADQAALIDAEIKRVEKLPAETAPEPEALPDLTADADTDYLAALERERARSDASRHEEIDKEIARVKASLRSARRVERATNNPV